MTNKYIVYRETVDHDDITSAHETLVEAVIAYEDRSEDCNNIRVELWDIQDDDEPSKIRERICG